MMKKRTKQQYQEQQQARATLRPRFPPVESVTA
jgi:hypothetical protein